MSAYVEGLRAGHAGRSALGALDYSKADRAEWFRGWDEGKRTSRRDLNSGRHPTLGGGGQGPQQVVPGGGRKTPSSRTKQ